VADYNLSLDLIGPLIDAIAFSGDSRLDELMEELDGIRKQVESGRSILISVNAYNEAIR
jgi:hypothetical protein